MNTYRFKYGDGQVDAALEEKNIIDVLHGNSTKPLCNIQAALFDSLRHPIGSLPLAEFAGAGDQIAIVVSDMSRFWMRQDLVIPHLVSFLNDTCNIPDQDIVIVIANGTHAGDGPEILARLVTNDILSRIQVVNHDCLASDLVYIGTTSGEPMFQSTLMLHPERPLHWELAHTT